jgi:hypothetical protein
MAQSTPSFDLGTDGLTTDDPAVVTWMHAFTADARED